jgi:hypothetical protein
VEKEDPDNFWFKNYYNSSVTIQYHHIDNDTPMNMTCFKCQKPLGYIYTESNNDDIFNELMSVPKENLIPPLIRMPEFKAEAEGENDLEQNLKDESNENTDEEKAEEKVKEVKPKLKKKIKAKKVKAKA